jgi:oligopeptide transport system substrate-binding protein
MTRLLVIPLAFVALLAGAFVWSGGTATRRADFAYIDRGDVITLDLNQVSYMQDFRMLYAIREGAYSPAPVTSQPIPAGATGYDLSKDARVWTFHLRPDAKWSNGDPVTAGDYVFSYRRMLEEPGEYTYLFFCFKNAEQYQQDYADNKPADFKTVGIEAVDDHTLRLTLKDPVAYMLELMAFPVFYPRHEKSMEPFKVPLDNGRYTYSSDYTRPPKKPGGPGVVTNGPYVLKQWDFKRRLILEKSPNSCDRDAVHVNRIEKVTNENSLTQFLAYERGDVDWHVDVGPDLAAELRKKGRKDLRTSPAFGTMFLTLMRREYLPASAGGGKNPLYDVRVRQALALATDKQFVVDNITRIGELPARTYLPPDGTLPDFRWLPGPYDTKRKADRPYDAAEVREILKDTRNPNGPGLPYDVKRAQQLLADAGYPKGHGFPAIPILFNSDNSTRAKIAQAMKSQWKQNLNIDVNIETVEVKIFKQRVSTKDYAIATVTWFGDYGDASTFTDKYLSTSLQNDSDWRNAQFDALIAQAQKEPDVKKRGEILSRAEHLIDTEVPIIPIYTYVNAYLSKGNVHGVEPNPRSLTVFKSVTIDK